MFLFDLEANALLEEATKLHCICGVHLLNKQPMTSADQWFEQGWLTLEQGVARLMQEPILVGHNIFDYDLPLIEKLYGVKYTGKIIDTLLIARSLHPARLQGHALETYGEELGIAKPIIEDWSTLSVQQYVHRCQEDVKINYRLLGHLQRRYDLQFGPHLAVEYPV